MRLNLGFGYDVVARRGLIAVAVCAIVLACTACVNVKAYERGYLADRIMQLDEHPEEALYETHMFRALAQGVQGVQVGGGGCGCEQ
ncbi:MAG: DUF4266 domain-containing protein [Gammaproteobacteria bacterium]|nr:DUF4266 domain-containing protein [Gammaproteobacteria bacterium]